MDKTYFLKVYNVNPVVEAPINGYKSLCIRRGAHPHKTLLVFHNFQWAYIFQF